MACPWHQPWVIFVPATSRSTSFTSCCCVRLLLSPMCLGSGVQLALQCPPPPEFGSAWTKCSDIPCQFPLLFLGKMGWDPDHNLSIPQALFFVPPFPEGTNPTHANNSCCLGITAKQLPVDLPRCQHERWEVKDLRKEKSCEQHQRELLE